MSVCCYSLSIFVVCWLTILISTWLKTNLQLRLLLLGALVVLIADKIFSKLLCRSSCRGKAYRWKRLKQVASCKLVHIGRRRRLTFICVLKIIVNFIINTLLHLTINTVITMQKTFNKHVDRDEEETAEEAIGLSQGRVQLRPHAALRNLWPFIIKLLSLNLPMSSMWSTIFTCRSPCWRWPRQRTAPTLCSFGELVKNLRRQ